MAATTRTRILVAPFQIEAAQLQAHWPPIFSDGGELCRRNFPGPPVGNLPGSLEKGSIRLDYDAMWSTPPSTARTVYRLRPVGAPRLEDRQFDRHDQRADAPNKSARLWSPGGSREPYFSEGRGVMRNDSLLGTRRCPTGHQPVRGTHHGRPVSCGSHRLGSQGQPPGGQVVSGAHRRGLARTDAYRLPKGFPERGATPLARRDPRRDRLR